MQHAQFSQLLLGVLRVADEVERGVISTSGEDATTIVGRLFPQVPFWRPLLDDVAER